MKDIHGNMNAAVLIEPAALDADNAPVGVDVSGFESALILIAVGAGGIEFTGTNKVEFKLSHSDDDDSYEAVEQADVAGVTVGSGGIIKSLIAAHEDADVTRIGYLGGKGFLKLLADFSGTHAEPTSVAALVLRANPHVGPVLGLPAFSAQPSITGTAHEGATLTGNPGAHSGAGASYRWLADEEAIDGETGLTLVLAAEQAGTTIAFEVTAINDAGSTVAISPATAAVLGYPTFSVQPSITGTAQVGATLTGHAGTHTGTSATYRWLADDVAIAGATGLTRVLAVGQLNAVITFEVTAINAAGSTVATSAATAAVIAA